MSKVLTSFELEIIEAELQRIVRSGTAEKENRLVEALTKLLEASYRGMLLKKHGIHSSQVIGFS